jgi:tripartite-type tricarboxylate transporter receptor subunit TctC
VARDLAGKQIMATVNNPAEAKGFYEAGEFVPLVAFSDERLPAYPDVPTMIEKGHDFSYYNQRAVVGAPGMSDEAAAYYQDLFTKIYESRGMAGLSRVREPLAAVDGCRRAARLLGDPGREPPRAAGRARVNEPCA